MAGWRRWGLGLAALLWTGYQEGDIRSPHGEKEGATRSVAREAAIRDAPQAPEPEVRFARARASESLASARSRREAPSWSKGRPARSGELEVITSAQSALAGERISVEVSTLEASVVRAEVFRLGFYGGAGALKVWSGGPYRVSMLPPCPRASGGPRTPCPERQTFSFEIAQAWEPGLYLVKVMRPDGLRRFTSLVVKRRRASESPP